jgi:hypothetical protein
MVFVAEGGNGNIALLRLSLLIGLGLRELHRPDPMGWMAACDFAE